MLHIYTTHEFTKEFIYVIFYVYTGTNYEVYMKLNVLDCKTDERLVTSALCYVEHGKIVCFGLHFCLLPV